MDTTELKDEFRRRMRDEIVPYLWSDDEVFSYMDRAQVDFCRYAYAISDSRSTVTAINLEADTAFYAIHPSILRIKRAVRESDGRDIAVANIENMDTLPSVANSPTGTVDKLLLGADNDYARCYPTPSATEVIRLYVHRLPITKIDSEGQNLEIHAQHHMTLVDGMSAYAHLKQDAETFDRGRSEMFMGTFRQQCDQAKQEREMLENKPRQVVYGGLPCAQANTTW